MEALHALSAANCIAPTDAGALEEAAYLYQGITQVLRLTVEGGFAAGEASPLLRNFIARLAGSSAFDEIEAKLASVEADVRDRFNKLIPASQP
jgi:hypothetical protein